MNDLNFETPGKRPLALLPLFLFILIFLGSGIYFHLKGTEFAFYQLASPVAILPAIVLALFLSRHPLNRSLDTFLKGAGDTNIITMCMIYLLAGAFSAIAKATGGVDATVNLALAVIPPSFLLPGIFLVAAFISTAMGTAMGTLAAIGPVALGIAQTTGLPLPVMAGAIMGGAIFGDNLSIISDTTIAATKTQGCRMNDKFKTNIYIAAPAALATVLILGLIGNGNTAVAPPGDWALVLVLPYMAILVLALSGLNVFAVLATGIFLAGGIGLFTLPDYHLLTISKDIYKGFTSMQEIFILSMLIGGLSTLMKEQGGLAFLTDIIEKATSWISKGKKSPATAEFGIGAMAFLTNLCTANNTVSIIITGSTAKEIAKNNRVTPRRSAGMLDIFACISQGLIPYGAQALLTASIFGISPVLIAGKVYYCMILAVAAIAAIIFTGQKRQA